MERRVAGAQAILIRGERIGRPAVRNAHHRRHFAHWPLQIAHQLRKRRARSRRSRGSKRGTAGHRVGAAWAGAETRDPAKKAISPKRKPAVTDGSGRGLKRATGGIPRGMLEKTPAKSGRHRIRTCDLYGVKPHDERWRTDTHEPQNLAFSSGQTAFLAYCNRHRLRFNLPRP